MARRNLCPNPAAKIDTTGWTGSATLARATDFPTPECPRSTGVRATGSGFIQTPAAACAPGDVFTASFYQHNGSSAFQFARTVFIGYTRSAGGDAFPESYTTASLGDVGAVARTSFTTAAAPADATGVYVLWDALVAGLGLTAVLLEKVVSLGTYADGDTSGWAWDGADGLSTSTEQPIQVIPDGIAVPVGLGAPTVSAAAAVPVPAGLAVPVHLGTPSTRAAPLTSAPGPVLRASSRKPVLLSAIRRR